MSTTKTIKKQGCEIIGFDLTMTDKDNLNYKLIKLVLLDISKHFIFQKEMGKEIKDGHEHGFVHWQIRLKTKIPMRTTALVKKLKGTVLEGSHISPTSKDVHLSNDFNYVMKEETKIEGPWSDLPEELMKGYIPPQCRIDNWRPWQQQALDLFEQHPGRIINVLVQKKGNKGKSTFGLTCLVRGLTEYVPCVTDSKDMVQMLYCLPTAKTYIINLTKSVAKQNLEGFFDAVETLKDGMIYDFRNKFKRRIIATPHVFIMTNTLPKKSLTSVDRWRLWTIDINDNLIPYIVPKNNIEYVFDEMENDNNDDFERITISKSQLKTMIQEEVKNTLLSQNKNR